MEGAAGSPGNVVSQKNRKYVRSVNYKDLSKLAKKILCHTATSVSSERIFSTASNVVSQKRSCLSPQNVNCLVLIFCMKICNIFLGIFGFYVQFCVQW